MVHETPSNHKATMDYVTAENLNITFYLLQDCENCTHVRPYHKNLEGSCQAKLPYFPFSVCSCPGFKGPKYCICSSSPPGFVKDDGTCGHCGGIVGLPTPYIQATLKWKLNLNDDLGDHSNNPCYCGICNCKYAETCMFGEEDCCGFEHEEEVKDNFDFKFVKADFKAVTADVPTVDVTEQLFGKIPTVEESKVVILDEAGVWIDAKKNILGFGVPIDTFKEYLKKKSEHQSKFMKGDSLGTVGLKQGKSEFALSALSKELPIHLYSEPNIDSAGDKKEMSTPAKKATPAPKPMPVNMNSKVTLPGFTGTVADLIAQVKEQRKTATGLGKRTKAISLFLQRFWESKGGRGFAADMTAIGKDVAKEVGIKFTPYTVVNRNLVFKIKEKGLRAFYVINESGVNYAHIDVTKPVSVAPSKATGESAISQALEAVGA